MHFLISFIFISFPSILTQVFVVAWNHHAPQALLSGSSHKTVVLVMIQCPLVALFFCILLWHWLLSIMYSMWWCLFIHVLKETFYLKNENIWTLIDLAFNTVTFCSLPKDVRTPSHSGYKWSVTAGVESLAWDPHTERTLLWCVKFHKTDP